MSMLTNALLFVLVVNALMFMGQAAMIDLNPDLPALTLGSTCEGTILSGFAKDGCGSSTFQLETNVSSKLPTNPDVSDSSSGNFFTDLFKTARNWVADATGISYLYNIAKAPYSMMSAMGLPDTFAFAVGAIWYGFTLILIVAFIFGRDI